MLKKAIYFIKYNNATVLILAIIIFAGGGAFAATETGQEFIGEKQVKTEGVDSKLLVEADLDNFNMDHKIERISEDDKYYYVTYTFLDIVLINGAWQYQIQENIRKVSKKSRQDLGTYFAAELKEQREARIKDLKAEKERALNAETEPVRTEAVSYSGLIGQTLDLVGAVFPGYEPVKKRVLPSPTVPPTVLAARAADPAAAADDLTEIYNDYIARMDPDKDDIFGVVDNCPEIFNPGQEDADADGRGDACPLTDLGQTETDNPEPDQGSSTEEIAEEITEETPVEELINEIISDNPVTEEPVEENTETTPEPEPEPEPEPAPEVEVIEL